MVYRSGMTALCMKVPGSITKLSEEVLSGMQREISMLENSKMIKLMEAGCKCSEPRKPLALVRKKVGVSMD